MQTMAQRKLMLPKSKTKSMQDFMKSVRKNKTLILMFLPGLILLLVFKYGSMLGLIIAFKNYILTKGIWDSPWVGLDNFKKFFSSPSAVHAIRNTLLISLYKLVWGFPAPIILALVLNEIGSKFYKRFVQTVSYLPHFLSWVILGGLIAQMLSPTTGPVNYIIKLFTGHSEYFLADPKYFRSIVVAGSIWQGIGWGTIIYLAAISSISAEMYEAAVMDGASRLQRIWYITLPSLLPLISIVLILRMGHIMNAGFDEVFNLYSPVVFEVGDIIDTYVYRIGIAGMEYSFTTAIGLFKSVIGLIMVFLVNQITKVIKDSEFGLW